MGRSDPFSGYSLVIEAIAYVLTPAFAVFQLVRLRRALHVFQLEGYKRRRFLDWCRGNFERALFLRRATAKKPLLMTGRAWRILALSTSLSVGAVVLAFAGAHFAGGAPYDLIAWVVAVVVIAAAVPYVLVATDVILQPVQSSINRRYLRLARRRLDRVRPLIIAVTGSFGKTSTKFAIRGLLGPHGEALATPGSFNTPLGVCRTINEQLGHEHEVFVVEMGAYQEGEIAELCRFVSPSIGVLTAIGPAHLERFGSLDAIARAKYEVVASLPPDGTAVMNVDDPVVRDLADATGSVKVVRYGIDPGSRPDVSASDIEVTPQGTRFTIWTAGGDRLKVRTKLLGRHALGHVLAAVAVAGVSGRRLAELKDSIESLEPVEHRLQLVESAGGVTVIDDAYNSNLDGAAAAFEVLASFPADRRVVVTPGIVELGPLQAEVNERLGEQAASVADVVIVVAPANRAAIVAGARRAANGCEIIVVDSLEQATRALSEVVHAGSVVLFENDLPDHYEA